MEKPKRHRRYGFVPRRTAWLLGITLCLNLQTADAGQARFENARPALERFIAQAEPKVKGLQHFCVVAYPDDGGYAWIHWREGNQLIFWLGAAEHAVRDDTIVFSTRKLDLVTDVVGNQREIGASTYLVTRAWVAEHLADCRKRGKRYVLPGH